MTLSEKLRKFIETQNWIFAKTYAETYPHEYIVQEKVDNNLFLEFAEFIDKNGYEEYFYHKKQIYFDFEGFTYWHMENIINRCVIEDTYHIRKLNNRLPKK
jgi:hypothetical protein